MEKAKPKKKQNPKSYTSLPWIPGLSQKLRKSFKKFGCEISFKSPKNLNSILTNRNKPQLPPNSKPGVYFVPTGCKAGYTGETKKKISSRNTQNEKAVFKGQVEDDALAEHKQTCECKNRLESNKNTCYRTNIFPT